MMMQLKFILIGLSCLVSACFISSNQPSEFNNQPLATGLERVTKIDFSSDGNSLLIAGQRTVSGDAAAIKIWDARSWEMSRGLPPLHKYIVWASFVPESKDNVVFLDALGGIHLWDLTSNEIEVILSGNGNSYELSTEIELSPSGEFLAIASYPGPVWILNIEAREKYQIFSKAETSWTSSEILWTSLAFSNDEKLMAIASISRQDLGSVIDIIDLEQQKLIISIDIEKSNVFEIAFSHKSNLILAGSNGFLTVINIDDGDTLENFSSDKKHNYSSLEILSDRKILVSGSKWSNDIDTVFGEVRLWDINAGELLCLIDGIKDTSNVNSDIALSPDGNTLATTERGNIRLWDIRACL